MMMRRYRYVEDGLTIGNPETDAIVTETRKNVKLWNRLEQNVERQQLGQDEGGDGDAFAAVLTRQESLMFEGMADLLGDKDSEKERCEDCKYKQSYGVKAKGNFGGVKLCQGCVTEWGLYLKSFPDRAAAIFPFLHNSKYGRQSITVEKPSVGNKRRAHGLDAPLRNRKRRRV